MAGPLRQIRHTLAYILVKFSVTATMLIPRRLGLQLFSMLGQGVGLFLLPFRNEMKKNLDFVFGEEKRYRQKRKIINGVFANLGMSLYDAIKLPSYSLEKFKKCVKADPDILKKALDEDQRGVILLGGHLSCFELQSQIFAKNNLPIVVIGAPLFDKRIDEIVEKFRRRNGTTYLHRDGVGRRLIKELKSNKIFGALIDQDATSDGVFAPFLGSLAFTPTGPIRMAVKFKIPLFFTILERKSDLNYRLHISGPVTIPESGDIMHNVALLAEQYNNYLSEHIKKCPDQWVWMHRRWNRKPDKFPEFASITDFKE